MQPNVHDALFKATFSRTEHAASILRAILPPPIAARVDFPALTLCSGNFVDEVLKERSSDLLFSTHLSDRPALIYLLFEHQSTFEDLMAFRLLRYLIRIWEQWLGENPTATRLPIILPIVLHHSEKGWTGATAFEDLLDADEDTRAAVAAHVPRFRFILEDISHETDEALRARAMTALARTVLWCLRHAREPSKFVTELRRWADLVREVRRAPGGAAAFMLILRYILEVSDPDKPEELIAEFAAVVEEEGKEEIVTVADWLREQGRERGVEQGRELGLTQGRREVVLDLLRERFGALPSDAVARVQAADMAKLRVWSKRVLTAPTLADVLAD